MSRIVVDPWAPSHGTSVSFDEDGPSERSTAVLESDLELSPDEWRPLEPDPEIDAPDVVYFVDGVRRIDARIWIEDDRTYAGIAASLAAGVVRCDRSGGAAEIVAHEVTRAIFTTAPDMDSIGTPPWGYDPYRVAVRDPSRLVNTVQPRLEALETDVSTRVDRRSALLVADGRLGVRAKLDNTVGFIKTHHSQYLPERLTAVVTGLNPGQRTPIFTIGTEWPVHTWYLRLPGPGESAWAGMVRVECDANLSTDAAIGLANLSAATLPRFASQAHKDARAPQNLVPIAGLEKRLRALLGDSRLLHRTLVRNASLATGVPA